MLKVGIHGDYTIAAGASQPGAKCGLVPEVSRQAYIFYPLVRLGRSLDNAKSVISASVIHDNYFVQPGWKGASNLIEQYRQVRFFIVSRDYD
jgi:hypothetical protein